MKLICYKQLITDELAGLRLDQALARLLPQFSRAQMQSWIKQGEVSVDKKVTIKPKERVYPGQIVELTAKLENKDEWQAQSIPLEIVYEDESLLVINKPPGLVVHPGAGNPEFTLVNALLHYDPSLRTIPRAGLVHRLDKDTSGLLLVARSLPSYHFLITQMQSRNIQRIYHAIVHGQPPATGCIDLPIGRHPTQRTKMSVLSHGGKPARTHYKVLEKFLAHSYLEIKLETGRTHQIRVHFAYINHPVVGDPLYSKPRNSTHLNQELRQLMAQFKRQALHAKQLIFQHPDTREVCSVESQLPSDIELLLKKLQEFG